MATTLSYLINSLADGIHKIKCKNEHDNKKCEMCRIKYNDCDCFFEYTNFKDNLIEYKCLCYNKNYQKMFGENLKNRFFKTYKYSKHDINTFILLLTNTNISMIGKHLVKLYYVKKKISLVTKRWETLLMQITATQKEFVKVLK